MNCVITVPAVQNGRGSKKERTGPVRDFIFDNDQVYRVVLNHVKACDKCVPNEVLRAYLVRRNKLKFNNMTSGGLVKLAFKYSGLVHFQKDDELVNEFIWRSGLNSLIAYSYRLSKDDVFNGMRLASKLHDSNKALAKKNGWNQPTLTEQVRTEIGNSKSNGGTYNNQHEGLILACAMVYDATGYISNDNTELFKLADVCGVMSA